MKKYWWIAAVAMVFVLTMYFSYESVFGAQQWSAELERFIVPLGRGTTDAVTDLKERGYVRNSWGFDIAIGDARVVPGGYKISKAMSAWDLASVLKQEPYMKWVTIPEGLRKEQIADILGEELGWDEVTRKKWITNYTAMKYEEIEGLYFPDTYLIPIDENPLKVADRLRAKFNDNFVPFADEALKQNIKWTTVLKFASLVQREAAGRDDMPLVAGILWNRILKDMRLEVDASIQYIRDDQLHYGVTRYDTQPASYTSEGGWWSPIKPEDKDIASPYNTYRNKGLPPGPIANPGIDAIKAVLYPAETDCFYYLHDASKAVHCAKTLEEHEANIAKYLR